MIEFFNGKPTEHEELVLARVSHALEPLDDRSKVRVLVALIALRAFETDLVPEVLADLVRARAKALRGYLAPFGDDEGPRGSAGARDFRGETAL